MLILPFEAEDARIRGRLSDAIGRGGADLMIAATALRRDAVVVTEDTADFTAAGVRPEGPSETGPTRL
ncbi:MAG: PIN domain-containing protein [Paracoccus sp. (in: a-proteobacteria)]|nr:PIN domain-containing protein [Paracoccus sp. (in: a-proteobacteria)]